ncbi:cytochrome P450-dit2 [Apophysomyces ossiformis]|uniref:Cytochrome P450-dit2 n=1 Tax=Apophysomyces ossiformis TaxID=679940 RepID=A0A8H7BWV2_9FUNG|nr:cytochrome P450-dit2 [Apophysomyces ossiformis]
MIEEYAKLSLERIQAFYEQFLLPRLGDKERTRTIIGSAAAVVLLYTVLDRILLPARSVRHIPRVSYLSFMKNVFTGVKNPYFSRNLIIPLLEKENSNGIYMRPTHFGWSVFAANPAAIKTLLLRTDVFPKFDVTHGREGTLPVRFTRGPNLVFLNGADWKKQRKIANPAFHRSMPVNMFGTLTQHLFKVMDQMDDTVNIVDLMERWTLDAIGKAGFDFDFHSVEQPDNEWVNTYNSVMKGHLDPLFNFFPKLDQSFLWLFPERQRLHRELTHFLAMLDNLILHKREALKNQKPNPNLEENEKDLLTLMIESELNGEGAMSNEELMVCTYLSMWSLRMSLTRSITRTGHDTTANALSFAIYYLAVHQDIQQRAREEALRILGSEPVDVLPTVEQTKAMDYINMVMKETLRLNGPAGEVFPRKTTKDIDLEGTVIPKGTLVTVDIYNLHRNPRVWQNPEEFNPERFAPGNEADSKAGSGMSWIPFSSGGRQCIGMNFSLAEQRVLLSMLLRKFTWTLPKNSPHAAALMTTTHGVQTAFKLEITFTKRY